MKIYIATVGGQIDPVFVGLKNCTPELLVLLHSNDSIREADLIIEKTNIKYHKILIKNAFEIV